MDTQSVRKTYKCRLYPTPEQERALDAVLWRCRALYNVALEERKTAWERCAVSPTTITRQTNCRISKPLAQSTVRSIPKSCKTC
jgi:transposase